MQSTASRSEEERGRARRAPRDSSLFGDSPALGAVTVALAASAKAALWIAVRVAPFAIAAWYLPPDRAETRKSAQALDASFVHTTLTIRGRSATVHVPPTATPAAPVPLVLMLHGYASTGDEFARDGNAAIAAASHDFAWVAPDGTRNSLGYPFWNATDACCDLEHSNVDDAGYLIDLLEAIARSFPVDAERIYIIGYSNGAFMAHRLACEPRARVAAVVSVAGATWSDPTKCAPTAPVAVLAVHGADDDIIRYGGGHAATVRGMAPHPSAADTVATWARLNGCRRESVQVPRGMGATEVFDGAPTNITSHRECAGGAAELWTLPGHDHAVRLGWKELATLYRFASAFRRTH